MNPGMLRDKRLLEHSETNEGKANYLNSCTYTSQQTRRTHAPNSGVTKNVEGQCITWTRRQEPRGLRVVENKLLNCLTAT